MDYFSNGGTYVSPDVATYDGPSYGTGSEEPFFISDGGGLAGAADYLFGSNGGQTSASDSLAGIIGEGLSLAYTSSDLPDFMSGIVSGANAFPTGAVTSALQTTAKTSDKSWGDMFDKFISDDKNKMKLVELGFGAVAGIAKASAAKDAAKYKAEADMAMLTKKDQLEQDANKRFSDSIGGLKPVKKYAPKPLTRMDGSRVFTPTGLINTGAK